MDVGVSPPVILQLLASFSNVCILRVRMPISDDLGPRNFITKIVKYEKVSRGRYKRFAHGCQ